MKIFASILCIAFVSIAIGQDEAPVKNIESFIETSVPGLTVDSLQHDFGSVFWGSPVSHTFQVANTSDAPVSITNIRSDCACSAEWNDSTPLQPGAARTLTVTYEPEYREGFFEKRITVYTDLKDENDHEKWFEFTVKGKIETVLTFDPWHVYFKKVFQGQTAEEIIHIRSDKGQRIDILNVQTSSEYLIAKLEPAPEPSGISTPEWTLTLTLSDTTPVGNFSETVTVTTNHAHQTEIVIRVLGFIRGPVTLNPTQCYLGTIDPGQVVEKSFTLEKSGDEADFEPPTINSSLPWLTYSIETLKEKKKYSIKVTITVPEDQTGRFSGQFVIETQEPSSPRFEIPVFGYILTPATETPTP